jgi:hypothetical protein
MNIREMYPTKYATGADLNGKAVTLTIAGVAAEKMRPGPGQPEVEKFVIYFKETKKGVVLSRTLARQIAQAIGAEETDNWTGKKITIFPESMNVAGVARVAIRARAAANGNGV